MGTTNVMVVFVQLVGVTTSSVPSDRTRVSRLWAFNAPNPLPRTVTVRAVELDETPPVQPGTTTLSTANTSGVSPLTLQLTGTGVLVPGAITTLPVCVGAVSVTVKSPGQAWKLVAIVRKRGL